MTRKPGIYAGLLASVLQVPVSVIVVMVITQEAKLDFMGCMLTAVLAGLPFQTRCC